MQLDTPASPFSSDAVVDATAPRSIAVRNGLLLLGLLTGVALYALWNVPWAGLAPSQMWVTTQGSAWLAVAMALLVQVPLWVGMAVTDWRAPRLWAGTAVLALVIAVMGGWAISGLSASGAERDGTLLCLAVALSLWWFVALAWFQAWLEPGEGHIPYRRLFVRAWNNALVLALAALCVNLVWGVLGLWAALFALLGVPLFAELFSYPLFVYLCSGTLSGLGLWIARTQERPIQMARQTLLALGRMLLPLMAWVIVLFVAALALTGLETLWATRFAAGLLMGVLLVHIWLVNAVYQDGSAPQGPYGRWVLLLVHASLVCMVVLAGLACVAVGLRVVQYGWTAQRVWAATGAGLLALYAAGYGWAAVRHWKAPQSTGWLAPISPVNRALSLVLLALLLALQTPVLDPQRISAASQLQRLLSGQQALTLEHLNALRFDHGRYGADALATLAQAPVARSEEAQTWVQTVQKRSTRSPEPDEPAASEEVSLATAQQRIPVAGNSPAPAPDWWQFVMDQAASGEHWASTCLWKDADCTVLSGDWDQDGQTDHLLCDLNDGVYAQCALTARAPHRVGMAAGAASPWAMESRLRWPMHADRVATAAMDTALRAGQLEVVTSRWPQWQLQVTNEEGKPQTAVGQLER